jgi:hypothetical protein
MKNRVDHKKVIRIIRVLLFVVSLVFIVAALTGDEYDMIFTNADNLCYSCMGLE